jgi:hypothetical protein
MPVKPRHVRIDDDISYRIWKPTSTRPYRGAQLPYQRVGVKDPLAVQVVVLEPAPGHDLPQDHPSGGSFRTSMV